MLGRLDDGAAVLDVGIGTAGELFVLCCVVFVLFGCCWLVGCWLLVVGWLLVQDRCLLLLFCFLFRNLFLIIWTEQLGICT